MPTLAELKHLHNTVPNLTELKHLHNTVPNSTELKHLHMAPHAAARGARTRCPRWRG